MLSSLTYDVTFPTGRRLQADLSFGPGSTAITGANESGKSFAIEMIRFNLFGAGALRGVLDDYRSLRTCMEFSVRGAAYKTERSATNARLFKDGAVLATGITPVNERIAIILGFDLGVFDVACAANQDEVLALGAMRPAERKRMVDQVIGLDRLDAIERWLGEEASLLNRELSVLERGCVAPQEPVIPADYQPSAALQESVTAKRVSRGEHAHLSGWLTHVRTPPTEPVRPNYDQQDLEQLLHAMDKASAARSHILSLPIIDPELSAAWDRYDAWIALEAFTKANPRPQMTSDEVAQVQQAADRYLEQQELLRTERRLRQSPEASCPSCGTTFCLEHAALEAVRKRLAQLPDRPAPDLPYALTQLAYIQNWKRPDVEARWQELKGSGYAKKPDRSRPRGLEGITQEERDRKLAELPTFQVCRDDVVGGLRAIQGYQSDLARYKADEADYEKWLVERQAKEIRADELAQQIEGLAEDEVTLQNAISYEASLVLYVKQKTAYDQLSAEIGSKQDLFEGWRRAKASITEIRSKVKTFLVPSLSKVASHLLAQMTGGQRSSIVVTENFDITVDGQKLETLSGSGKACANLALRIGLGQVLTNNVLSLFIGDEIDASMDADRAENTQDSLRSLSAVISQIIIVTHKIPVADAVVRLE